MDILTEIKRSYINDTSIEGQLLTSLVKEYESLRAQLAIAQAEIDKLKSRIEGTWAPDANSGMQHPEKSDLIGGLEEERGPDWKPNQKD